MIAGLLGRGFATGSELVVAGLGFVGDILQRKKSMENEACEATEFEINSRGKNLLRCKQSKYTYPQSATFAVPRYDLRDAVCVAVLDIVANLDRLHHCLHCFARRKVV